MINHPIRQIDSAFHSALLDDDNHVGVLVFPDENDDVCGLDLISVHWRDLDKLISTLNDAGWVIDEIDSVSLRSDHLDADGFAVQDHHIPRPLATLVRAELLGDHLAGRDPQLYDDVLAAVATLPIPPAPFVAWSTDRLVALLGESVSIPEWARHIEWFPVPAMPGTDFNAGVLSCLRGRHAGRLLEVAPADLWTDSAPYIGRILTEDWHEIVGETDQLDQAMIAMARALPPRDTTFAVWPAKPEDRSWISVLEYAAQVRSVERLDDPAPRIVEALRLGGIEVVSGVRSFRDVADYLGSVPQHWFVSHALNPDAMLLDIKASEDDAPDWEERFDSWRVSALMEHLRAHGRFLSLPWQYTRDALAVQVPELFTNIPVRDGGQLFLALAQMKGNGDDRLLHPYVTASFWRDARSNLGFDEAPEWSRWRVDSLGWSDEPANLTACEYLADRNEFVPAQLRTPGQFDAFSGWPEEKLVHLRKEAELRAELARQLRRGAAEGFGPDSFVGPIEKSQLDRAARANKDTSDALAEAAFLDAMVDMEDL